MPNAYGRYVYILEYKERPAEPGGYVWGSRHKSYHVGIFGTLDRAKHDASPADRSTPIVWEHDGHTHIGDDPISGRVWTIRREVVR